MDVRTGLRLLAAVLVLVLVGLVVWAFWAVDVCEQQAPSGQAVGTVEVCRRLALTDPPVVVVGLVLLGLVGAFYTEVSGFGITLKRAVEGAQASADQARAQAARTAEETALLRDSVVHQVSLVRQEVQATMAQTATAAASAESRIAINNVIHVPETVTAPAMPSAARAVDVAALLAPVTDQPAYATARVQEALARTRGRPEREVKVAVVGGIPPAELVAALGLGDRYAQHVVVGASERGVAAIAASALGNLLGLAPAARVLFLGVVDDNGGGSLGAMAEGINTAIAWGCDVLLLEVGAETSDSLGLDAVLTRASQTTFVVVGAGNAGQDGAMWPGSLPAVTSVAATSAAGDALAPFTNRGPTVDVAAPGVDVLSLRGVAGTGDLRFDRLSGTSVSAELVAAVAALLVSRAGVDPSRVGALLKATASVTVDEAPLVDALAAVEAALAL